jgi:hypothetical protein
MTPAPFLLPWSRPLDRKRHTYVIEGENDVGRIVGVTQVPGKVKDGDSYRCKLTGIYAVILLTSCICRTHQVAKGKIVMVCDNEASLRVFDSGFLADPQKECHDLLAAIGKALRDNPMGFTLN